MTLGRCAARSVALALVAVTALGCAERQRAADGPEGAEGVLARPYGCRLTLAHGTQPEVETRDQLYRLLRAYALEPYLYTREIVIDEKSIPHSHVVLTVHTRHTKNDDQLLSTFLHEQLHWFAAARKAQMDEAIVELRAEFPGLPVGYPDGGSSERSSYEHLAIIWGEYEELAKLVGTERADAVFRYWEEDHYRMLYRILRLRRARVAEIVKKHALVPVALEAAP